MKVVQWGSAIAALFCLNTQALAHLPLLAVIELQKPEIKNQIFVNDAAESALTARLAEALKKSNAFSVLDHALSVTDLPDEDKAHNTNNPWNVDYLVTGVIEDAHIRTKLEPHPDTHVMQRYKIGNIQMKMRVIDARTGKVMATLPLFVHKQFLLSDQHPLSDENIENILTDTAANAITDSVTEALFPPRVMQINNNVVYIHRSDANHFAVGDVLTVYKNNGAATHTPLPLGRVTVTEVNPHYMLATITTGDPQTFADAFVTKHKRPTAPDYQ